MKRWFIGVSACVALMLCALCFVAIGDESEEEIVTNIEWLTCVGQEATVSDLAAPDQDRFDGGSNLDVGGGGVGGGYSLVRFACGEWRHWQQIGDAGHYLWANTSYGGNDNHYRVHIGDVYKLADAVMSGSTSLSGHTHPHQTDPPAMPYDAFTDVHKENEILEYSTAWSGWNQNSPPSFWINGYVDEFPNEQHQMLLTDELAQFTSLTSCAANSTATATDTYCGDYWELQINGPIYFRMNPQMHNNSAMQAGFIRGSTEGWRVAVILDSTTNRYMEGMLFNPKLTLPSSLGTSIHVRFAVWCGTYSAGDVITPDHMTTPSWICSML